MESLSESLLCRPLSDSFLRYLLLVPDKIKKAGSKGLHVIKTLSIVGLFAMSSTALADLPEQFDTFEPR